MSEEKNLDEKALEGVTGSVNLKWAIVHVAATFTTKPVLMGVLTMPWANWAVMRGAPRRWTCNERGTQ